MPPTATSFVVSALVRRDDRLILVEERAPGDAQSTWMLPGGRLEDGETLVAGLRRELSEETGLQLVRLPVIAFAIDITARAGRYVAITFACDVDGDLAPDDPDGFVLGAEWLPIDEALARLRRVSWYDCVPLERYVSGLTPAGATYEAEQT
jgi:8-oxo-dGTP diphosphatase